MTAAMVTAGVATAGAIAAALVAPVAAQVRIARAARPLTDGWSGMPVAGRGATRLGLSFRPRQAEAMGLESDACLRTLLAYPFQVIRLAAYWDRIEPAPGSFQPDELDRQIDAAEQAGKDIIVCVGAVKAFGYPEFFVPGHHLPQPLREGRLVEPGHHPALLGAATGFVTQIVRRYRDRPAIVAWQVEHEAVDPLGMEHSWRLSEDFVRREVDAVRAADPTRPVLMNGFLPTSLPVAVQQGWRTRDQGDSLSVAQRLADIVGVDFYPRHALVAAAGRSVYLDGSRTPWQQRRRRRLFARAAATGKQVMVSEGQAEPWEAVTDPPSPDHAGMYSCLPEHVIGNFNQCMRWSREARSPVSAYLFWGAEYWLLRERGGDSRYLRAFQRVLECS
ncbi:beta-galactosidase [Rugosimonospora africana]|uniref:Glycoside hydrolase family 42 N-terminal domain-containing protein n=1 Tax=Rugosimonospora africana TaxID=556532 RepID=A0A8J3QT10_9ACTN|nr:beta-galactosidase [Rugosimonospora africana]GIH16293.1 hypothetical protein Raf01_44650 [Rugosimonospora africana]